MGVAENIKVATGALSHLATTTHFHKIFILPCVLPPGEMQDVPELKADTVN